MNNTMIFYHLPFRVPITLDIVVRVGQTVVAHYTRIPMSFMTWKNTKIIQVSNTQQKKKTR